MKFEELLDKIFQKMWPSCYEQLSAVTDALQNIAQSSKTIKNQYHKTVGQLEEKASSISILKDFSDVCYITFDPEELLYIVLERSLLLTNSNLGSILTLEEPNGKSFIVTASIGGGEFVKKGDKIDFETSIAKYAVINKSPLVVKDIENDSRFGRKNRSRYGTKSFICLPIKTSTKIIGVLTISRKNEDKHYSREDVAILTSLVSIAAFRYENLRLLKRIDRKTLYLKSIETILKILRSNSRGSELLHAIINEIQEVIPFDYGIVMAIDECKPDYISIISSLSTEPANIANRYQFKFQGSLIDKALKQEGILIIDDTKELCSDIEKELFMNQGCKSCLLAPIKMNGVNKGLLALSAKSHIMLLKAHDFIKMVVKALSLAIDQNWLSEAVVQRKQELDTIRKIGTALASSTFDIKQVLNYTMDMIREAMNVEAGSLYLVKGDELEFAAAFNIEAASIKRLRLKLGQGVPGYVASKGESIIINDTQTSPYFFPGTANHEDFKTRSALCIPMISQGKVVGVIEAINKINGDFVGNDKDLLQSIGASVSIAIENAGLYSEIMSIAEQERGIRTTFQQFVPKEVLKKIVHGSETGIESIKELKILTLLNIDIRGFSDISRRLGPQKTVSLLNHFFSIMGGLVFKHHGIVDKYLGDGFLAIFGAPVSNSVDADNAIAAALEMQESVSSLNDYLIKELGTSISIGISVHTGEMVVGNIGFDMKMDYTVIGDSVNDVFRLQELTKPINNGILISEKTSRASQSLLDMIEIESSSCGETSLGNFKIYELLGFQNDYIGAHSN